MNTRLTFKQLSSASLLAMTLPLANTAFAHDMSSTDGKQNVECKRGHHAHHQSAHKHGFRDRSNGDGVPHYLRSLTLSQAQKDQIFTIRHEQAPAIREQQKQRHTLLQDLRETTQAPAFDDAKAQQIAASLADLEREQVLMRARTQAKVFALLTPEQREKAQFFSMRMASVQVLNHITTALSTKICR